MKKKLFYLSILSLSTFTACRKDLTFRDGVTDDLSAGAPGQLTPQAVVPNELLVKFKKGLPGNARAAVLARIGGNVSENVLTKAM